MNHAILSHPKAINSISIHRKSIPLREPSTRLLPFTHIQMNSRHKHPQGDSAPAAAGVEDQSEHHLMKPESGACSDSDGHARRHAGLSRGRSSFTRVWVQFGIHVSKLENVHQSTLSHFSDSTFRLCSAPQGIIDSTLTRRQGQTAERPRLKGTWIVLWIQAVIYVTWFPPLATDLHLSALGPVKTTMVRSNSESMWGEQFKEDLSQASYEEVRLSAKRKRKILGCQSMFNSAVDSWVDTWEGFIPSSVNGLLTINPSGLIINLFIDLIDCLLTLRAFERDRPETAADTASRGRNWHCETAKLRLISWRVTDPCNAIR